MTSDTAKEKKILIVEDDPEIRDALTEILEFEGYQVAIAKNGKEGIDYLRTFPSPSLILLDFMMPIMNGQQFLEAKKEDPGISQIPVVILSADNAVEQKAKISERGQFLKKPVELDHLLDIVNSYCQ
jgi:CheY-like chemotaxis protein